MTLDKEEHRAVLLELIERAAFPGVVARKVVELQEAIEQADVAQPKETEE
jgi:hypothetical protein